VSRWWPPGCSNGAAPRPRSLDPDFTDWDPEDIDTWDERIVMVADDEDFLD
jgi:predicted DNA-binding transcriptional regulator AlpA